MASDLSASPTWPPAFCGIHGFNPASPCFVDLAVLSPLYIINILAVLIQFYAWRVRARRRARRVQCFGLKGLACVLLALAAPVQLLQHLWDKKAPQDDEWHVIVHALAAASWLAAAAAVWHQKRKNQVHSIGHLPVFFVAVALASAARVVVAGAPPDDTTLLSHVARGVTAGLSVLLGLMGLNDLGSVLCTFQLVSAKSIDHEFDHRLDADKADIGAKRGQGRSSFGTYGNAAGARLRSVAGSPHRQGSAAELHDPMAGDMQDPEAQLSSETSAGIDKSSDGERIFAQMFKIGRPELAIFCIGFAAAVLEGVMSQAVNIFYGAMLDEAVPCIPPSAIDPATHQAGTCTDHGKKSRREIFRTFIMMLSTFGGYAVLDGTATYFFGVMGERFSARLRVVLFGSVIQQDVSFFDVTQTGELTNRLSTDCAQLQTYLTAQLKPIAVQLMKALVGVVLLFRTSWKLTLVMLSLMPIMIVVLGTMAVLLKKIQKDQLDALAAAGEAAEEAISLFRTVRCFGQEKRESTRYQDKMRASFVIAKKRVRVQAVLGALVIILLFSSMVIGMWYGSVMIIRNEITKGALVTFIFLSLNTIFALLIVVNLAPQVAQMYGSAVRVTQLLRKVPSMRPGGKRLAKVTGAISFNEVSFRYPSRPKIPVLQKYSLDVAPGQKIALVGSSGAGKSTIIALLERFYDPIMGTITVDGHDISSLDPLWLRQKVFGLVQQEPNLFACSVHDNILYGVEGATEEEVKRAAVLSNAHDFIERLPEGYQTELGERGVTLSGGQKQRVAIARAVIKDPPVLLLDEATSALDSESERVVKDALDKVMKGRTTIIIAHRLSTVMDCDKICVMDAGQIVEMGTHTELIALNGVYTGLVKTAGLA